MWVWFFKTLCFVCVSFSSSLFITAAFFFALLLGTGYAIFRKYALQMNHQMIVVKLQPLWMLLVRRSTRVCSGARGVWGGWPLVWVVQAREEPLLQSLHAENIAWRSTKWRRASLTDTFTNFWPAQASATPKFPQGKNTAIWKKPSEVTPPAPQEPCRGVKSKVTINSVGIAWKHCAMDSFQPANILSWKGDCWDFLQTQTSPCTFYNQILYLDLAQHKLA